MGISDRLKRAVEVTSDELAKAVALAEKTATDKLDAWLAEPDNDALAATYRVAKAAVEDRRDMLRRRLEKEDAAREEQKRKALEAKEARFAAVCSSISLGAFNDRISPEVAEGKRVLVALSHMDAAIAARMKEHADLQAEAFALARELGKPVPPSVFARRTDVMEIFRGALRPKLGDMPDDLHNWITVSR